MPLTVSDIIRLHDAGFSEDDINRFNTPKAPDPAPKAPDPAPKETDLPETPPPSPSEILSDLLK